jgi:hypothetical protein
VKHAAEVGLIFKTRLSNDRTNNIGCVYFTQWLAVHMAQNYLPRIRVNAIAPGFFVGQQNRRLLLNEDGSLTPRGSIWVILILRK